MIEGINEYPTVFVRLCSIEDPSGVYGIFNMVNGKVLVGSSIQVCSRWKNHQKKAEKGTHGNPHFQAAWVKYGADAFEFRILEICWDGLVARENYWMDYHHSLDSRFGYNMQNASQTIITPQKKVSSYWKGKHLSESHRKNVGDGKRGGKATRGSWKKGHVTWCKGKKCPQLSEANRNRPPPSKATREKMRLKKLGGIHTTEHNQKIRETCKKTWRNGTSHAK
jgi:group I intron endonuclease